MFKLAEYDCQDDGKYQGSNGGGDRGLVEDEEVLVNESESLAINPSPLRLFGRPQHRERMRAMLPNSRRQ